MADYAHTETDKRIEELEKRLQAEYRQAYKETKGKLEKYLSDFARKDEEKRKLVEKGELSQADYKKWRTNQMLTGQRWVKMVDTLAKDMNNTNQIAADIISGKLKGTFALNANYAAYGIENGFRTDYGFTLYSEDTVNRLISENPDLLPEPSVDIPADLRWNKQKITSNITQAVLQGKSIPEIAKSMQTVVGMNKASAVRNARTAMTGAQNAGRQQAYERAAQMGIKLQKEWMATLDGRTRHSHGMADGQKVDINGMFSVGGCKMRYPGDVQNGTAAEIYNCRCTMCTVEPPEIMQGEEPRMTYSEWVQTKEGQEATGGRYAQKTLDNGGGSGIMKARETTVVNAKSVVGQWKHRSNFDNDIDDIIDYQGFNGNPKIVYNRKDFDDCIEKDHFLAERTFCADTQEQLDLYDNQLKAINGENYFYVNCGVGGAQYGQGMYCAADYTKGTIPYADFEHEIKQYAWGDTHQYSKTNWMTLDPSAKILNIPDGYDRKQCNEYVYRLYEENYIQNRLSSDNALKIQWEAYQKDMQEVRKLNGSSNPDDWDKADILSEKAEAKYPAASEFHSEVVRLGNNYKDTGVMAAEMGYDAINAKGHGTTDSYTVVLNRTKLIIYGGDDYEYRKK